MVKHNDMWAAQSSDNHMSSNRDVEKSTQTTEQQTLPLCARNVLRERDDVTRHVSNLESQLIDDQEQKIAVKDIELFFHEFQVDDAWILADHDVNVVVQSSTF